MMRKRALLVSPDYMNLYQDIKRGLEDKDCEVVFVAHEFIPNNPHDLLNKGRKAMSVAAFDEFLKKYWEKKLKELAEVSLWFDYLLVVDGLNFHPLLIEKLRSINPKLKAVNYLFDRIKGIYQLEHNFKYFDRVFSFDKSDSLEYNLSLLPIYWVPMKESKKLVDIFALGGYDEIRGPIFKRIREIAESEGLSYYIKLYRPHISKRFKYTYHGWFKRIFKGERQLSLKEMKSDLFTETPISTDQFRVLIYQSGVVVDTNHPYQDGLTARFMWALGAEKKIITNNINVKQYSFYTPQQIFVLDNQTTNEQLISFIRSQDAIPDSVREITQKYRIDNWLSALFESN